MKEILSKQEQQKLEKLVNRNLFDFNKRNLLMNVETSNSSEYGTWVYAEEEGIIHVTYDASAEECYVDLYDRTNKEHIHSLGIFPRDIWEDFETLQEIADYIIVEVENAMQDIVEYA